MYHRPVASPLAARRIIALCLTLAVPTSANASAPAGTPATPPATTSAPAEAPPTTSDPPPTTGDPGETPTDPLADPSADPTTEAQPEPPLEPLVPSTSAPPPEPLPPTAPQAGNPWGSGGESSPASGSPWGESADKPDRTPRQRTGPKPGTGMIAGGGVALAVGVVGVGVLGAGLAKAKNARQDLETSLPGVDREDVFGAGKKANNMAIAGAVVMSIGLAVGIALIAAGAVKRSRGSKPTPAASAWGLRFAVGGAS